MFFYYLLFLLLLLSQLQNVVVAKNKLEELNIAEKTILAEHYMRIGIQLCQYQKRLSSRNAFFAKTMEIILWPIRRDKQISNQVDDDILVQNFLNFDGPPSSCVFSTSEWSETESANTNPSFANIASFGTSFLSSKCLRDLSIDGTIQAFERSLEPAIFRCSCSKSNENYHEDSAFSEAVKLVGNESKIDVAKILNANKMVIKKFQETIYPLLGNIHKRIQKSNSKTKIRSIKQNNGENFDLLMAYLFNLALGKLIANEGSSENKKIGQLRQWFERQLHFFVGACKSEKCKKLTKNLEEYASVVGEYESIDEQEHDPQNSLVGLKEYNFEARRKELALKLNAKLLQFRKPEADSVIIC